jgi:hypothetical protein
VFAHLKSKYEELALTSVSPTRLRVSRMARSEINLTWLITLMTLLVMLAGAIALAFGSLGYWDKMLSMQSTSCGAYLWTSMITFSLLGTIQGCSNAVLMTALLAAFPQLLCARLSAKASNPSHPRHMQQTSENSDASNIPSFLEHTVMQSNRLAFLLMVYAISLLPTLFSLAVRSLIFVINAQTQVEVVQKYLNLFRLMPILAGSFAVFFGIVSVLALMMQSQQHSWSNAVEVVNPFKQVSGDCDTTSIELSSIDAVASDFSVDEGRKVFKIRFTSFWKIIWRLIASIFVPHRFLTLLLLICVFAVFATTSWMLPLILEDVPDFVGEFKLHMGFQAVVVILATCTTILVLSCSVYRPRRAKASRLATTTNVPVTIETPGARTDLRQIKMLPMFIIFALVFSWVGFMAAWLGMYVLPNGTNFAFAYLGLILGTACGIYPATVMVVGWIISNETAVDLECWRIKHDPQPNPSANGASGSDTQSLSDTLVDVGDERMDDKRQAAKVRAENLQQLMKARKLFSSMSSSLTVQFIVVLTAWCMVNAMLPYLFKFAHIESASLYASGHWKLGTPTQRAPWVHLIEEGLVPAPGSAPKNETISVTDWFLKHVNSTTTYPSSVNGTASSSSSPIAPTAWTGNNAIALLVLSGLNLFAIGLLIVLGYRLGKKQEERLRIAERERAKREAERLRQSSRRSMFSFRRG